MNQKTLGIGLVVVVILVGVGYFAFVKKSSPAPTPTPVTTTTGTTSQKTPTSTQPAKSGWKTISWHDLENTVLGFHFDSPNSWVDTTNSYGSVSERLMEIASCAPNTCDTMSFRVQVLSRDCYVPDPLPANYTKTKISVGGISADKVIAPTDTAVLTDIGLMKDNNCYAIELYTSKANQQQADSIFNHILETFAFTTAQPPQAPAEYDLFKNIDKWSLTYQDSNTSALVCTDGRKGDTTKNYVFQMSTQGDTNNGTSPGDIDTPYQKVITALKNNGWQQCKAVGETELQDTQGTSEVFIKSNKLIGVFKHYSMGVGNSLGVSIQY